MLCSNAEIKIILSIIQKTGNIRSAKNLLYILTYIAKTHKRFVHTDLSTCSCDW